MERDTEPSKIGEILTSYFKHHPLLYIKITSEMIIQKWGELVGNQLDRYSKAVEVKGKTLYVKVTSPSIANELALKETLLLKKMREMFGENLPIERIAFKTGFFSQKKKEMDIEYHSSTRMNPRIAKKIEKTVECIKDEELKKALTSFLTTSYKRIKRLKNKI